MPIIAEIDTVGVRRVTVEGGGAGPLDDAVVFLWPAVRRALRKLDATVKREADRTAAKLIG